MKKIGLLFLLITFPLQVFAACNVTGTAVVYVNGIFTSRSDAKADTVSLEKEFERQSGRSDVDFINGYNESHLGGGGDLYKSIQQAMQKPAATVAQDYDLKTILMQIQPQVTTRKILLVGHSQGTFYTNSIYRYLLEVGVPEGSIAVYNLATPASYVDGVGSMYLTSANDKLIRKVRDWAGGAGARAPLPDNIRIPLPPGEEAEDYGGHHFASSYLNQEPDRIVGDISKALAKLKAGISPATDGCFTPPPQTLSYKAAHVGFALGDPTVGTAMTVVAPAAKVLAAATQKAYAAAAALARAIGSVFTNLMRNPQVSAASQGAAAASAFTQSPTPPPKAAPPPTSSTRAPISTAPTVANPQVPPVAPPPPTLPPVAPETLPPAAPPEPAPTPPAPPPDTSAQQALQSVGGSPTQSPPPTVVFVPLAVSSPSDGASYATSSATFTGTTTAGFVVALTYGPLAASATADASGDWSVTLVLPEGITVVGIVAADAEGNTSDAATRTLTVDTTPPLEAPTASIVECLVPAGEYCALPVLIVNLQWNAISDATHYAIAKNGIFDSTTTDTAMEFRLEANATTTFAVGAYYASGNAATSTEVSVFTFLPDPPPGIEM